MSQNYWFNTPSGGKLLSTQPFMNGNVHLATGAYLFYALKSQMPAQEYADLLAKCQTALKDCEISPGLYKRNPDNNDQHGPDDLFGISIYSASTASLVWEHLSRNLFFYDITGGKKLSTWMGRMPGLLAHIKVCSIQSPGWFLRKAWCFSVRLALKKPISNQDGWIQTALMVEAYKVLSFLPHIKSGDMDEVVREYEQKKPKISEVYAKYIGDAGHPLVEICEKAGI